MLKAEFVAQFRLETESPVDDLLLFTTVSGRLFVRAKTNLGMAQPDSGAQQSLPAHLLAVATRARSEFK